MDRGRVEEDRGSKETDGCPLTIVARLFTPTKHSQSHAPLSEIFTHHSTKHTVANIDAPAMDSDRKQRTGNFCSSMLIDIHYEYRSALMHFQHEFKHRHMHHCHHHTHCKLNSPVGMAPQARGEMVGRW
jgi:hypothetical protein